MKKCPKCGTILDDSKKKCYMCGADLLRSSITNFGDSFNEQIGATVTTSQDNVFNNVENITAKVDDVVSNNDNATFSQQSSSVDFFKNEMSGLNSLQYDDRTPLEKIFTNDSKYREKDEIDAESAMKNNNQSPIIQNNPSPPTGPFVPPADNNVPVTDINNQNATVNLVDTLTKKKKEKKVNPQINWGNNLTKANEGGFWDFKNKKSGISMSFIVNTACFILFVVGIVFVYFNFIKSKDNGNSSFGGLNYKLDEKFELKSDNANSRYYINGDNCTIRINYGAASGGDGFIESYYEGIKSTYENQPGYTTVTEKMQINGNVWSELNVVEIKGDSNNSSGYTTATKFRHTSIVYNANFYDIVYTNLDNDSECTAMYKKFTSSLTFD